MSTVPSPTPPPDVLLSVRDLQTHLRTDAGRVRAVDGVSFDVRRGEVLAIVGESGSGKSVTAMSILGLVPSPPAEITGAAEWGGRDLIGLSDRDLRGVRGKEIAMIFQDPMTALNPVFTVGHQIAEAVRAHEKVGRRVAQDRAVEMLDLVGIPEPRRRARGYPHELSGGMRQRAMIAMAISCNPDLLIADEPTTALDVTVQAQVLEVLQRVRAEFDSAVLLITHDLGVVAGNADRVMVMYAGRAVETGTVDEIFYRTRHPYTLGLLASLPRLDEGGDVPRLHPIRGNPPSLIDVPPGCPFHPRCEFRRLPEPCATLRPTLAAGSGGGAHQAACHFAEDVAATDTRELREAVESEIGPGAGS
jgi:peptide/nickel transport system ATP-binding protein